VIRGSLPGRRPCRPALRPDGACHSGAPTGSVWVTATARCAAPPGPGRLAQITTSAREIGSIAGARTSRSCTALVGIERGVALAATLPQHVFLHVHTRLERNATGQRDNRAGADTRLPKKRRDTSQPERIAQRSLTFVA